MSRRRPISEISDNSEEKETPDTSNNSKRINYEEYRHREQYRSQRRDYSLEERKPPVTPYEPYNPYNKYNRLDYVGNLRFLRRKHGQNGKIIRSPEQYYDYFGMRTRSGIHELRYITREVIEHDMRELKRNRFQAPYDVGKIKWDFDPIHSNTLESDQEFYYRPLENAQDENVKIRPFTPLAYYRLHGDQPGEADLPLEQPIDGKHTPRYIEERLRRNRDHFIGYVENGELDEELMDVVLQEARKIWHERGFDDGIRELYGDPMLEFYERTQEFYNSGYWPNRR